MVKRNVLALRNRHFFVIDLALLPAAALMAFVLRLDATAVQEHSDQILLYIALAVPVKLVVFYLFDVYGRYWRYASTEELMLIVTATGVSTLVVVGLLFGLALPLSGITDFPRSIPFIDGVLTLLVVAGPRFAVRMAGQYRHRARRRNHTESAKRVLVMGAGDAGKMIVREMQANPQLGLAPIGFLDDDRKKHGVRIHGVRVLGGREEMPEVAREHQVAEVIIAMPTAPGSTIRQLLDLCQEAGVPARTVPGMYDILSGEVSVSQIREVDIEDLLRREPVQIDASAVEELLRGRRVLVTGGGGSIGSELCRQIARAEPECLIVLGHGENSVFDAQSELRRWAGCDLVCTIADIRDQARLAQVFAQYRPDLVFHAAAHKHVPLMEANVCEAVSNNVLGTRCLMQVAGGAGVSHFILISTDKAVNPTSIMGATKRVTELLVYQAARRNRTCFAAVRFGNVLGSRGSVVHTFRRQIAQREPVTVTHPDMRRFFMTIPEAVQLVLQAAALGQGGEVFVLDMGEQVRIVDLATDLIQLSGLRPRVRMEDGSWKLEHGEGRREGGERATEDENEWDIEVVFTGARPGEKLYEELFAVGEDCRPTRHEKILVAVNGQDRLSNPKLDEQVDRLVELAQQGDEAGVRRLLKEIVPEYVPVERVPPDGELKEPVLPVPSAAEGPVLSVGEGTRIEPALD